MGVEWIERGQTFIITCGSLLPEGIMVRKGVRKSGRCDDSDHIGPSRQEGPTDFSPVGGRKTPELSAQPALSHDRNGKKAWISARDLV